MAHFIRQKSFSFKRVIFLQRNYFISNILIFLDFFKVMGGQGSDMFEYFKILILQGLVAASKHSDKITTLVDVMRAGNYFFFLYLKIFFS